MSMDEVTQYVETVVIIGCLIFVGASILDSLSSAEMINTTGAFNGTATNIANMWSGSTGMIATVIIIGAAAIIIKMVMGFRKSSD